jgi:hypothetical protein
MKIQKTNNFGVQLLNTQKSLHNTFRKTLQRISLLHTFLIKNAKKYLYNTFKKKFLFGRLKVEFSTFKPSLSLNNIKSKI